MKIMLFILAMTICIVNMSIAEDWVKWTGREHEVERKKMQMEAMSHCTAARVDLDFALSNMQTVFDMVGVSPETRLAARNALVKLTLEESACQDWENREPLQKSIQNFIELLPSEREIN